MWVTIRQLSQTHHLQYLVHPLLSLTARQTVQPKRGIPGYGQVRKQRIVLEHHAQAAFLRRNRAVFVGHQLARYTHRAAVGLLEAGNQTQRGGFAAATRT